MISAVSWMVACVLRDAYIDLENESQHVHGEELYAGRDVKVILVVEETFYRG
jgi:hypothetical protein